MSNEISETRKKILDASVAMLKERGGKGVRMGDIAKAAGVSRQAVYLHFASRAELLVATTRHLDEMLDVDARLEPSRSAADGERRLALYIECWGQYIPEIYSVAKAIMLDKESDEAAAAAWDDRMLAMRDGCRAAIEMLHQDGRLSAEWSIDGAIDALWTLLMIPNWENLTQTCQLSNDDYIKQMQLIARRCFVAT